MCLFGTQIKCFFSHSCQVSTVHLQVCFCDRVANLRFIAMYCFILECWKQFLNRFDTFLNLNSLAKICLFWTHDNRLGELFRENNQFLMKPKMPHDDAISISWSFLNNNLTPWWGRKCDTKLGQYVRFINIVSHWFFLHHIFI